MGKPVYLFCPAAWKGNERECPADRGMIKAIADYIKPAFISRG
jgi:hypothetical protein